MQISVFNNKTGGLTPQFMLTIAPVPVGTNHGVRWYATIVAVKSRIPVPALAGGIYEWKVFEGAKLIGLYVGKTTGFRSRIGHYWRDMTPQLIHALRPNGGPPLKANLNPRVEIPRLRWIHLWLAWAYAEHVMNKNIRVELWLSPCTGNLFAQEKTRIHEHASSAKTSSCLLNDSKHTKAPNLGTVFAAYRAKLAGSAIPPPPPPFPPLWGRKIPSDWDMAESVYGRLRKANGLPHP